MNAEKIFCIIPARGGSKRLPGKNIRNFCGKPLIAHTIDAAKNSGLFDEVVVSTEDAEIAAVSLKYGASVLERSRELAGDKATVLDVCSDALGRYEKKGGRFAYICILLPTSPLRTAEDLVNAFKKLKSSGANALMAVTTYGISPFWALKEEGGFLTPFFGQKYMVRSQDLPAVCVDNGAVYMFKTEAFKKEKTYYCQKLVAFKMPREKSIDIDEEVDFLIAEYFMNNRLGKGGKR